MLSQPPWISFRAEDMSRLPYVWDDTRASEDFKTDVTWLLNAADAVSRRAQMVLCVGLYEWIVWRFAPLDDDPAPRQVLEAAWCATVDPRYIRFFELTRPEWLGPVRGPLWCAITWLRPALADGDALLAEVGDGLQYLARLGLHVLPDPAAMTAWLKQTLGRFTDLFPAAPDDPFADLFARRVGERRNALIGRDALDPQADYAAERGPALMAHLLASANPDANPFLSTPAEMAHSGFPDIPYSLRP